MSNNIYDILKKIESLEAPKKTLNESKSMDKKKEDKKHESKKKDKVDKGAIAEAVAKVENQLNEKYMGFKKTVAAIKKGGSAENPEAVAAAIGRKKYGKEKFQKAAAAGKKLGEGQSIDDRIANLRGAIKDETPRSKPGEDHKEQYARHAKKIEGYKAELKKLMAQKKLQEGEYNEDMLSAKEKSFAALAEPKDKITYADKIAGAKKGKKTEGNKFSGNLMKARAQGLKQADLDGDGDMEPVRGGKNLDKDQVNEWDVRLRQPYGPEFNRMFGADIAGSDEDKAIISKMKPDDYVEKNKFVKDYPTDKDYQEWNRRQDVIRGKEQQDMYNYVQRYNRDNNNLSLGQWAEKGYNKLKSTVTGKPEPKTSYQAYRWDPERGEETHRDERDFPVYPNKSSTMKEARTSMREGWEEMQKYLEKKRGPESKGGEGKKAGTRYGGSAQKDDDEEMDGEGQPTVKKKGRPKGTGGGAKHSFKKPKD